jgi:enoyl-CoA hydratase
MIEATKTDNILTIRLAHGKASALDLELAESLALTFAEAAQSDAAAVILTGTGSIFSAGVDLFRLTNGGREYCERFVPALSRLVLDLFAFPKPLVVAVNGHAIAGGCIMTLCGDYRLMATGNARIGMPELLVGVPFPPAILEVVRFCVAPQHLQSLIYTGRTAQPDDALRYGFVDELVAPDALLGRAEEVARQIAAGNAKNFALTKRELRDHTISRAKHYANELDDEILAIWSDESTHANIREYLARTVKK